MHKRRASVLFAVCLLVGVLAVSVSAGGKKSPPTAPGTYKAWGPDIDQLEIVKTFKFADYNSIVVKPFDTSSTPLPGTDDNTYAPVTKVLASATEGFVQGLRGSVQAKVIIAEGAPERDGALVIRGKVAKMDPGSAAGRFWGGIYGGGAAKTAIEGEIVDARSGDVLARFKQERRSTMGRLPGDYQELMQRNLNTIGEDVANILKAF